MADVPDDVTALEAELRDTERILARRTDPGPTAMLVSLAMLALLGAMLLPWSGHSLGWHVLAGIDWLGPLPRLFTYTSVGFGLVVSALALATRSWVLAWVCAVGSGISVINGLWSIWTRQVVAPLGESGPAFGMILAVVAMVFLAANWARIALRR